MVAVQRWQLLVIKNAPMTASLGCPHPLSQVHTDSYVGGGAAVIV